MMRQIKVGRRWDWRILCRNLGFILKEQNLHMKSRNWYFRLDTFRKATYSVNFLMNKEIAIKASVKCNTIPMVSFVISLRYFLCAKSISPMLLRCPSLRTQGTAWEEFERHVAGCTSLSENESYESLILGFMHSFGRKEEKREEKT